MQYGDLPVYVVPRSTATMISGLGSEDILLVITTRVSYHNAKGYICKEKTCKRSKDKV